MVRLVLLGSTGLVISLCCWVLPSGSLGLRFVLVQELKVGLSQASVLSVFHTDAEDFFNVNNNLEKVSKLHLSPHPYPTDVTLTLPLPRWCVDCDTTK